MYEFIYHIYCDGGFKIGKSDSTCRISMEEKCGLHANFFDEEQLQDLEKNNVRKEEDAENLELARTEMATWEKKYGLWVVLQEHRLEVLYQHHARSVTGPCGRHRTQELALWNFIWHKWT